MFDLKQIVRAQDPAVWQAIDAEARRQEDHIELIASENYASPAVMAAQGSCLTNKYAEGYPGKRYYGGCQYVDDVARLAIARAKQLFCDPLGVDYADNVQPPLWLPSLRCSSRAMPSWACRSLRAAI